MRTSLLALALPLFGLFALSVAQQPPVLVTPAALISRTEPIYPPEVTGRPYHVAFLDAVLGTDGKLHDLESNGDSDAYTSAAEMAASDWLYKPFLQNGTAIAKAVLVSVVFNPTVAPPPPDKPMRVSGTMTARLIEHKVSPINPSPQLHGVVSLSGLISKSGRLTNVQVVSGPAPLLTAAIEAAQQWSYRPYFDDGQPTEIQTTLSFKF